MKNELSFAVVGGDLRQCCLCNLLAESGYPVRAMGLDTCAELSGRVQRLEDAKACLPGCPVVVFPLPVTTDARAVNAPFAKHPPLLEDCMRYIDPGAEVFGGMVGEAVRRLAQHAGHTIEDYYTREELIVRNCVPTCEGALAIAMQETAKTIFGSRCLVTGFGRVARTMAHLLLACGAQVSVAARKQSDLAWISLMGARAVPMPQLAQAAAEAEILFNTVPAPLLDRPLLEGLNKGCLIIDLASKPGGVDFEAAKALGLRVIWALSLPGKVAPVSAAEIVRDTLLGILQEKGKL